ncbi:MAG: pectate lyase [Verrucomicrobiota bacterium]
MNRPSLGFLALPVALVCVSSVGADPVTSQRVESLPAAEQAAWQTYLETSRFSAVAEQSVLQAELSANGMSVALRPPSGGDFKVKRKPGDPWFSSDEAKQLTDAILSYQTPSGGWSKHLGFSRGPRKPGMQWTSQSEPGKPFHYPATFDNHSTTGEMAMLACVWQATGRDDCKQAFVKGLDYVLAAQYPNGGWPQVYPLEGGYHDDITLNDDAMTHILELLHGISSKAPHFAFLDQAKRKQAADAMGRGIACLIRSQVVRDGEKTVWCAQMDALTLQPAAARKMEPAALSGLESAKLLKFLMTLPAPSAELTACIESGLKWFEEAKVEHPELSEGRWARFYDLKSGKPMYPGRDGVIYHSFEALAASNEVGYDYFSTLPSSIVGNGQKKWRKMVAKQGK